MNEEYAKNMVEHILNMSVSQQTVNEIKEIVRDEQSPVTYKNADPRETYKEFGDNVKKALDPQQKRGIELEFINEKKKFIDNTAKKLIDSGKNTKEEAYKQAQISADMMDNLARTAFEQEDIRPSQYYNRVNIDVASQNIEDNERNVDESDNFDTSFDPVDFDENVRAQYYEAQQALQEEQDNLLANQNKKTIKQEAKILGDMGIGAIRRPTKDSYGKERFGEYQDLSPRIKRAFFTDSPTAMTWDEAEDLLKQNKGNTADIFEYLTDIDKQTFNQQGLTKESLAKIITKEKQDIKDKAITDGTFLKAPNGKKSNLPENLWLTVRTQAFKSWFGDWENNPANASKVVDENGEPLVVYHGTTNKKFSIFDKEKIGQRDSGFYGKGFYFANTKGEAGFYGKKIYSVFLNIKNPLNLEDSLDGSYFGLQNNLFYKGAIKLRELGLLDRQELELLNKYEKAIKDFMDKVEVKEINTVDKNDNNIKVWYAQLKGDDDYELSYDVKNYVGLQENLNTKENAINNLWNSKDRYNNYSDLIKDFSFSDYIRTNRLSEKLSDIAKEKKYDGIFAGDEYIAFEPNQIKSINNRGSFDNNNPDIYFQSAYHGTPHRFDEFSTENIGTGEGAQAHGWGLYFAGNKNISDRYRRSLSNSMDTIIYNGKEIPINSKDYDIIMTVYNWIDDKNPTIEQAKKAYIEQQKFYAKSKYEDIRNFATDRIKTVQKYDFSKLKFKGKGQLFKVDIPEEDVLLDEDKTFDEQPKKVQEALLTVLPKKINTAGFDLVYSKNKNLFNPNDDLIIQEAYQIYKQNPDKYFNKMWDNLTGRELYGILVSHNFGNSKEASLALNEAGIKGITYDGQQHGRAYVIFDDKAVKVLEKFYQKETKQQEQPRGVTTAVDRKYFIQLFSTADKSTLLHEMAHIWLSDINYFATDKNASQKTLNIKKQLDNWLGEPQNNGRYSVEQQEKFATSFETYLKEGKAPVARLKTVFAKFREWLARIYDNIKNDLQKIDNDVRELFDSILSRSYDVPDSNIYAGKEKAIKEVIKNINEGKASEVDGITIDDVYNLLNVAYMRKPSKPTNNLKQLLNDNNIYDFNELNKAGKEQVFQILKDGGYIKEDDTAQQAVLLAQQALDGKPIYRLADNWRVAGDVDFNRNLRVLEKVIEFSQIDNVIEKILNLQQEGYRNVEQGDVEQVKNEYKRLFSADVKEAKKIVEDIINRLHKKRFIDKAAQKQMIVDLNFSSTVEEIKESVLNVIEDLQDEIKLVKEQIKNASQRKPVIRKDKTIPPQKNATEEEKNNYKKYMKRQINRLLKQALPRKQNQKKFSKFDVATQQFFTELERFNKMTIEQAQEELYKRATSIIDEEGVGLDNFEKMKNMFLSYKANKINQNSVEFYKQLYDNLQEINVFGRNVKEIENTLKKEKTLQDINSLVVNIEENKSKNKGATIAKKFYVLGLGNWWSTINAIAGKKQADKDSLEKVEIDVFNKDYELTENVKTKCAGALGFKNATDLDMTVNRYLKEKYIYKENDPQTNTTNEIELNKMQLICCYIWMKNSNLRDRIVRAYGNGQIMDMMKKLTIQDKKFGDELQKSVADMYDDINAVYLRLYGLDMPQAENYFPSSVERIQGNMDLLKDNISQVSSPGFIKARTQSKLPLMNFGNPVRMALNHICKVNRFIYMQEKLADINKIYKPTIVKRHIINAYGESVYRYITQLLDNAKFSNIAKTIDLMSSIGDYVTNNYVLSKIALKPSIMIKQLLSCINYAEDMSSVKWFKGFLQGVASPKKTIDFMMANSKYCKSRFEKGGQTEALLKAIEGQNATFAKIKTFKGMLSFMTRVGDIGAIIFGGYPYVMEQMSKGVPLKTAIENFEKATIRSQQASLPSTLSNWQYKGMKNWFLRAMFAFSNTPNQYCRKIGDTIYMYFHGDIGKKQMAKNLIIYCVLNSLLYTSFTSLAILSGLVSGDWDDLKDDMVMSLFQCSNVLAVPLMSQGYNYGITKLLLSNNAPQKEIPLLHEFYEIVDKLKKEDIEFNDWLTIIDDAASLTAGAPIKTIYNTVISSIKEFYSRLNLPQVT